MKLQTYKDPTELSRAVADWLVSYIGEVLERQNRFTIALSGGSTPQKLFELLATPPYRETIAWDRLHIFWGDERYVPFTDERNNARMASEALLNHVPIPKSKIHHWQTDLQPEAAAAAYGQLLHHYFDKQTSTFDLVLLGMGDDGHTLSLFPGTEVVFEDQAWTSAYHLNAQDMYRLTLTAPVVNQSACVAFLVTGQGKATVLKEVLHGTYQPAVYPSQRIQPANGELIWFVDEAAAGRL
ncbi:6-phosphogluconolactonase [Nibrella saemangeumensis]|uniref:6-phosphogluconolactonase n=1 Tax=Nibrella saemangeumensis TaxID=1084526 RepID=A0ABP8MAG4_9BACT